MRRLFQAIQVLVAMTALLAFPVSTTAQDTPVFGNPAPSESTIGESPDAALNIMSSDTSITSQYEFWLSLEVLLFGLCVLVMEFLVLRRIVVTSAEALRVYGVTLILVGTLFALTAGFDDKKISPVVGLFGTVAGYLLGRTPTSTAESESQQRTDQNA